MAVQQATDPEQNSRSRLKMSIIDNQMALEIAKDKAKQQINCQHEFKTRHIELLDMDIEICSKCDINKNTYELLLSFPCFGKYQWYYQWYKQKCWFCNLSLLCKAKKEQK